MPKPTVVISVLAAVAVLVAAGLLVSLVGDDGPDPAPKDYATFSATYDGRTVRFAYPRAWGAVERRTKQGVEVVRVFGPPDAQGTRSVVRMAVDPGTTVSFDSQYGLIDGQDRLQMLNDKEISVKSVDVPGAQEARQRVLDYDFKTKSSAVQRSRSSTTFAIADNGLFVNIVVDTPAAAPDVDADTVLGSLTLDG